MRAALGDGDVAAARRRALHGDGRARDLARDRVALRASEGNS
jgi:hypothetical protein